MKSLLFWGKLTLVTLGKLCQRRLLLAGLALLCLLLPLCVGTAAEQVLSEGVSFSGITLAVTAPEGDPVPQLLEQYMPNMSDISQYCRFLAMDEESAREALDRGEVTAILVLPENFIQGVMYGTNPDLQLIVPEDRPLESLLTLWVAQSATDMLSSFQSGVYAVLELYTENPPAGLTRDEVMTGINLRYINWTLNRQDLFRTQTVSATDTLSVPVHYGLSLLAYLALSLAPLFTPIYDRACLAGRRRLRTVGRGSVTGYLASLTAGTIVLFPILAIAQFLLVGGALLVTLGTALSAALFCSAFGSLCCLLTERAGSCGALAFACSLVFLALGGGILPPVLLPQTLRSLMWLSPVTWLRELTALSGGRISMDPLSLAAMTAVGLLLITLSALLYRRRSAQREVAA